MTEIRQPDVGETNARLKQAMEGTIGVRNPKGEVLDAARQAALDAAEVIATESEGFDEDVFARLGEDLPGDLRAWLLELPSFLAKKDRAEQGHELCDRFTPVFGAPYLDAERCVVLLESGDKEAARALVKKCDEQHGRHSWVLLRGAAVSERLGDFKAARNRYQSALEQARNEDRREDLRFAYDALIQFHQDQGEEARAVELGREMLQEMPEIEEEFRTEQIVNEDPKVGRNDPCPCNSGKKFKKCCGRR